MTIDHSAHDHAPPVESPPNRAASGGSQASKFTALAGEILIMAGVLVALYLVWSLFYTDVLAARDQKGALEDLNFGPLISADGTYADDGIGVPEILELIPAEFQYRDTPPPVMDVPEHATTFGAMYVPRWGQDYAKPIAEGVTRRDVLDTLGIGRYPQTAMPGELGNFAVAGHRTTYGKVFADVDQLVIGDSILVRTADVWYVYTVTEWKIVAPDAVEVIAPVPGQADAAPDGRYITLTTCHPKYSAAQRWIVHGELEYWSPTGMGFPPEFVEDLS